MAVLPKAGARFRSTVCETEVVVVKAPAAEVDLRCGGAVMVPVEEAGGDGAPTAPFDEGTLMGKRYVADDAGLELLCTKPGAGSLSVGAVPLLVKGAKPLPSSD